MTKQAVYELGAVVENVNAARQATKAAKRKLEGTIRKVHARDLQDMLADALAFAERLEFILQADAAYEAER